MTVEVQDSVFAERHDWGKQIDILVWTGWFLVDTGTVNNTSSWFRRYEIGCLPYVFLIFVFSSRFGHGMQFWRPFQVGFITQQ